MRHAIYALAGPVPSTWDEMKKRWERIETAVPEQIGATTAGPVETEEQDEE